METLPYAETQAAADDLLRRVSDQPSVASLARRVHALVGETIAAAMRMDDAARSGGPDLARPAAEAAGMEARRLLGALEDLEEGPLRLLPGALEDLYPQRVTLGGFAEAVVSHVAEITRAVAHEHDHGLPGR